MSGDPHHRAGSPRVLAIAGTAAALFVLVYFGVRNGGPALDRAAVAWMAEWRSPWLDAVAREITALGNTATLLLAVVLTSVLLPPDRRRASAWLLIPALVSGIVATRTLKLLFGRPRPDVALRAIEVLSPAFPSEHAMMSAVVYGTLGYVVAGVARPPLRRAVWITTALLVLLVGATRIYLGVHFPSDVVAGWLGGVAWALLVVAIWRARRPE